MNRSGNHWESNTHTHTHTQVNLNNKINKDKKEPVYQGMI